MTHSSHLEFLAQQSAFSEDSRIPLPITAVDTGVSAEATIVAVANNAFSYVTLLVGIVAVFSVIRSGFLYITAGGDVHRAKEARAGIVNAVIGIVIIMSVFSIVKLAVGVGNSFVGGLENTEGL